MDPEQLVLWIVEELDGVTRDRAPVVADMVSDLKGWIVRGGFIPSNLDRITDETDPDSLWWDLTETEIMLREYGGGA